MPCTSLTPSPFVTPHQLLLLITNFFFAALHPINADLRPICSNPFHLQLVAPSASLRFLYTNTSATTSATSPVRVCLMRLITANSHGNLVQKAVVSIGIGELCALPPRNQDGGKDTLTWDGCLRCDGDIAVGGFTVGNFLTIKVSICSLCALELCVDYYFFLQDYIVLDVYPPHPRSSPLVKL